MTRLDEIRAAIEAGRGFDALGNASDVETAERWLLARLDEAREALEPFSRFAEWSSDDMRWAISCGQDRRAITDEDLQRARAALAKLEEEE